MDAVSVVSRDDSTFINVVSLAKKLFGIMYIWPLISFHPQILQIFLGTG
jgi:hypothetical protein